jgi:hypothetical protein
MTTFKASDWLWVADVAPGSVSLDPKPVGLVRGEERREQAAKLMQELAAVLGLQDSGAVRLPESIEEHERKERDMFWKYTGYRLLGEDCPEYWQYT